MRSHLLVTIAHSARKALLMVSSDMQRFASIFAGKKFGMPGELAQSTNPCQNALRAGRGG